MATRAARTRRRAASLIFRTTPTTYPLSRPTSKSRPEIHPWATARAAATRTTVWAGRHLREVARSFAASHWASGTDAASRSFLRLCVETRPNTVAVPASCIMTMRTVCSVRHRADTSTTVDEYPQHEDNQTKVATSSSCCRMR